MPSTQDQHQPLNSRCAVIEIQIGGRRIKSEVGVIANPIPFPDILRYRRFFQNQDDMVEWRIGDGVRQQCHQVKSRLPQSHDPVRPGSSASTLEAHKRIIAHSIDLTIRNHQCGTDVLKESVHYSVSGLELIILLQFFFNFFLIFE